MGKASRRPRSTAGSAAGRAGKSGKVAPAPYVARPFAGLGNEPDWVAIREILPAATATVHLDPETATALLADLWASVGDRPLLVITHDPAVVARCDRTIALA